MQDLSIERHSYGEQLAKDFEPHGHARIALSRAGTPASSRASVHSHAIVTRVESLPNFRTRLTLESGRTMTMQNGRWVLAHFNPAYVTGEELAS